MQSTVKTPVIIAAIALVVVIAGYFIFNAIAGGKVEQGEAGRVEAAPKSPSGGGGAQPGAPPGRQ